MRGKIGYHSRSHGPGGSDSIAGPKGAIFYDFDNVGGYLRINTTSTHPLTGQAIDLTAAGGPINVETDDAYSLSANTSTQIVNRDFSLLGAQDGIGTFQLDSNNAMTLNATANVDIESALLDIDVTGSVHVDANDIDFNIATDEQHNVTGEFNVTAAAITLDGPTTMESGNVDVKLPAGATFTLYNHLNAPKVRWTEGTNNLHIPTGGSVVADL